MQDFSLPAALRSIAPIVKSLAQASSSNDWRNTLATVIGVPLSTSVPPIALCPLAALTASRQQRVTDLVASETLALVSCISQFTSDERLCTCDTANRLGKSLLLLCFPHTFYKLCCTGQPGQALTLHTNFSLFPEEA